MMKWFVCVFCVVLMVGRVHSQCCCCCDPGVEPIGPFGQFTYLKKSSSRKFSPSRKPKRIWVYSFCSSRDTSDGIGPGLQLKKMLITVKANFSQLRFLTCLGLRVRTIHPNIPWLTSGRTRKRKITLHINVLGVKFTYIFVFITKKI